MKKIFIILSLLISGSSLVQAQMPPLSWPQARLQLKTMEARFRSPQLTEQQKVKLLPQANELLSIIQDLHYSQSEKTDQIQTTIDLIAAALEVDFASSMIDTMYFDIQNNKNSYLLEIENLPSIRTQNEIKEILAEMEEGSDT